MYLATRTVKSRTVSPTAITRSQAFNSPATRSSRTRCSFIGDLAALRRLTEIAIVYCYAASLREALRAAPRGAATPVGRGLPRASNLQRGDDCPSNAWTSKSLRSRALAWREDILMRLLEQELAPTV